MADQKMVRLSQAARKLSVSVQTIADYLASKGFDVDAKPNSKISSDQFELLKKEFASSMAVKEEASGLTIGTTQQNIVLESTSKPEEKKPEEEEEVFILDTSSTAKSTDDEAQKPSEEKVNETPQEDIPAEKVEEAALPEKEAETTPQENIETGDTSSLTTGVKLKGPKVVGKIDLDAGKVSPKKEAEAKPEKSTPESTIKPQKETQEEKKETAIPQSKPEVSKEVNIDDTVEPTKVESRNQESDTPPIVEKAEDKEEVKIVAEEIKKEPIEKETPIVQAEVKTEKEDNTPPQPKESTLPSKPKVETPQIKEAPTEKSNESVPPKEPINPEESKSAETEAETEESTDSTIEAKAEKLQGLKVVGKIELPTSGGKRKAKPIASSDDKKDKRKRRKRVRVQKDENNSTTQGQGQDQQRNKQNSNNSNSGNDKNSAKKKPKKKKEEISQKDIDEQYKKTLAELGAKSNKSANKREYKRKKREAVAAKEREKEANQAQEKLKVTEFISASDLASLMDANVNDIILKCMEMGMFVSINQRLDAEAISIISEEFGYEVDFTSAEDEIDVVLEEEDAETDLVTRAPIVTIMGHVDHGKTSLLDFIRDAKVVDSEAGGITQHIGAYDVVTESGRRIAFLDTPGHEAFTAMRARGAKVTDVAIIVVAADDSVMPQTIEAINHAQVAGVPFVVAINKIDKPNANSHKIKEELANMNVLIEEWGGKVQSQEISAKTGVGIDELLDMVLLEADILDLKANPTKNAVGTVVEASLDKGRGYVTTILVQAGTLQIGDIILAGQYSGRVKAMFDHRGNKVDEAGPSTPVQLLGLNGAPQAGDKLNHLSSEREAKDIANKREQIIREQSIRTTKRVTLGDIGRRIALGNYKQLNIILKSDVDGSVEALTDSLLKLSTDEIEVNIIHRAVGPISESDILLAAASDAIVIGFQVRPTPQAKRVAEQEEVEIRLYSIIYDAINDVKDAMEGLLSPDIEEVIVGNAEAREVFKISKVGTVAGCMVTDGYIKRQSKIRIIRDGIVVFGGEAAGEVLALRRFKDDVSEVKQGFECGISVKNYNDIKQGDVIEAYEIRAVKRTL